MTPRSYRSFALTTAEDLSSLLLACGLSLSVTRNNLREEKLGALVVKIWFAQNSILDIATCSSDGTRSFLASPSSSTSDRIRLISSADGTARSDSR